MNTQTEAIASFYDEFSQRLLKDYVRGNRRVKAAMELVADVVMNRKGAILDIGCGIGASSHHYSKLPGNFLVHGVDISPKCIAIANQLFADEKVSFSVSDMSCPLEHDPFDAIVLIDVYEHVPRPEWRNFNVILSSHLAPHGVIILTTPTPLHQEYLKEHKPEGLQVVDETVFFEDIQQLASDTGTTVTHYRYQSIWNTHDYLHTVLQREPQYKPLHKCMEEPRSPWKQLKGRAHRLLRGNEKQRNRNQRREFVESKLNIKLKL